MSEPLAEQAWSLFEQALDLPASERAPWLAGATADDPVLRREVQSLLAAHEREGVLDHANRFEELASETPTDEVAERLGRTLAGRYGVDRVLGQGGMATVFLARDLEHHRAVVLKVLKPEVAAWLGAERFQSEIHIAAHLAHPNILALVDSGQADGLLYYVMPYLGGETLRVRMGRGALPAAELLAILSDVAGALAHAHRHQIVHRDLKPENVLTVGSRGFLMDFGVAKLRPAAGEAQRTADGVAIGTPAYMAPEQAAGAPVDARADVYAWGLVAQEGLLGKLDRKADLARLRPDVPAALRSLIAACLADDPGERPPDGGDLARRVSALEAEIGAQARARLGPLRRFWPAGFVAGVAALVLLLAPRRSKPPPLDAVPGPIAVAGLRNETGDSSLAVWGRLAGAWITEGLQRTGRARILPWSVALEVTGRVPDDDAVAALRDEIGAATVVTGSYRWVGDEVHLQVALVRAETGALLGTVPGVRVARDSLASGVRELRDRLLRAVASPADRQPGATPGRPPSYDGYLEFERGLGLYRQMEYAPAGEALINAWRRDTTVLTPLVYAARALMFAGDRERVDSLVRSLRARSASLGSFDDHQVRYLEGLLAGDAKGAFDAIRLAAAEAPGSRAGYSLALTALSMNRPDEALTALRDLDPDRGSVRGFAPYWYALSHALHLLERHDDELAAVQELRRRHPENRAAWVHEARALATLGRLAALDSLLAQASTLPPDTYWSLGAAMVTAAEELDAHGPAGRSTAYYRRAERWLASQLARDPRHRAHRYWLGSAYYDEGRWLEAAPYFESLVEDYPSSLGFRGMWALLAARNGDTVAARRRLGDLARFNRGLYTAYRARIAAVGGDREGAIDLWKEALSQGVTSAMWLHSAARRDLLPLAASPRFEKLGLLARRSEGAVGQ